jgi:hypothetical protein
LLRFIFSVTLEANSDEIPLTGISIITLSFTLSISIPPCEEAMIE